MSDKKKRSKQARDAAAAKQNATGIKEEYVDIPIDFSELDADSWLLMESDIAELEIMIVRQDGPGWPLLKAVAARKLS